MEAATKPKKLYATVNDFINAPYQNEEKQEAHLAMQRAMKQTEEARVAMELAGKKWDSLFPRPPISPSTPRWCTAAPGDRTEEQQKAYYEAYRETLETAKNVGLLGDVVFCKEERPGWDRRHLEEVMAGAAEGGHEDLCRLAKEWGCTEFASMAKGAAKANRKDLCLLAIEWTEEMGLDDPLDGVPGANYDDVLYGGALGGNEDMCRFAKDNGATNFDGMLWDALKVGDLHLADLAVEWGAISVHDGFSHAAAGGHESACVYVKDVLKQTNFEMMKMAAHSGEGWSVQAPREVALHPRLVALAEKWMSEV